MKIIKGSTRLVVLIGDKSLKIGKIRPFRTISKIISLPFSEKRQRKFSAEYGDNFIVAVGRFLIGGIWANRNEFHHYQKYLDTRVMPTLTMFWGGLLIIQERGISVTKDELAAKHPLSPEIIHAENSDLLPVRQYCRCSKTGLIKLVDYGNSVTRSLLEASLTT